MTVKAVFSILLDISGISVHKNANFTFLKMICVLNKNLISVKEGRLHAVSAHRDDFIRESSPLILGNVNIFTAAFADIGNGARRCCKIIPEKTYNLSGLTLFFVLVSVAVTLLLGYQMAQHLKREMADPINRIADAAVRFAGDRKKGITGTDHFRELDIRTGDEVEHLNLVMAQMEKDLSVYMEDLTVVTQKEERVRTELDMASKIQKGVLPDSLPFFSEMFLWSFGSVWGLFRD